uniref:RHS repeat-associated core domain-containing protein n=1 Tax=Flavobacterium sp. J27 TaxID=2060419 RepID=UPI00197A8B47
RTNSLFNWTENFQYDNQDRLTHYTNTQGVQVEQIYENDGRIKENTLGTYNYSNSTKKYQNTSIDVTAEAKAYYANRLGLLNDSMEQQVGWTTYYDPTVLSYDSTVGHTGTSSIKINNTTTSEKMIFAESWIAIDNAVPTEYTYSAWVKSDGTNPQAEVFMYMKTENETAYATTFDGVQSATSTEWVKIEKTVLVPANIKKLNIRLDNNSTGILWFDDIQIRKTSEATPTERQLNISYNTWKSPFEIYETGVDRISFTYNHANNRSAMYYGGTQADKMQRQYRKYYSLEGSMEIKHNTYTDEVEFVTYVGGDGYTAPVVYKTDGTTGEYLFLHRDYLGSIVAITDISGNVVEKRLFDAWGEVIKVVDGQGTILTNFAVLDRGDTGHEHLTSVGLVHLNGRLYDAKLHRFLQPDNNIQDPYNTQNYNRYGYVLNNPLKYNDPSGEFGLLAAVVVGAVISATSYTLTALLADVPFTPSSFILASFLGAHSSAMTFGLGNGVATIFNFKSTAVGFFQTAYYGTVKGFVSGIYNHTVTTLSSGGSLRIADLIKNASTAAATSGLLEGITGGLKAIKDDSNFWTGKSNWKVVGAYNRNPITGKYDFSGTNWEVKAELEIDFSRQTRNLTCTYHCKRAVDWFFLGGDEQQEINSSWFDRADANGIKNSHLPFMYESAGYNVEIFSQRLNERNISQWAINQMNSNRIVQISWQPDSSVNIYHASLITKIEQNVKNLTYRFSLMDPAQYRTFSFSKLKGAFSVWMDITN